MKRHETVAQKREGMLRRTEQFYRKYLHRYRFLLFFIMAAIVALFYGVERYSLVDFICTNGDYQNYNALRRFLDGQIPYHDFSNYLGMGVIALCAPLLAFNNTLSGSLLVTFFVAAMAFIVFVGVIFYLVTGRFWTSAFAALIFPKLISSYFFYLVPGYDFFGYYMTFWLDLLLKPNNSYRIVRMFWPVLLCSVLLLMLSYAKKKHPEKKSLLREWYQKPKWIGAAGAVLGAGVFWSNDYGLATIASYTGVFLVLSIVQGIESKAWSKVFRWLIYYLPSLLAGFVVMLLVVTRGHPMSYFSFTGGVADWQFWYYGIRSYDKIYGFADLFEKITNTTWVHLLVYVLAMCFCLWKLCKGKANDRMILFVILYTSIVAAQFVYILGSGGDNFTEAHYGFVIILFFAGIVRGIEVLVHLIAEKKEFSNWHVWADIKRTGAVLMGAALVIYISYVGFLDVSLIGIKEAEKGTTASYVQGLDGSTAYKPEFEAMLEITEGKTLFSTYATAIDDLRGEFQPTGVDYIIHALGDERYTAYLNQFKEGKYDFVQTTNFLRWVWEPWLNGSNWLFYREVYSDYEYHSDHSYWTLWEYKGEDANVLQGTAEVSLKRIDENNVTVEVTTDVQEPCYVDVYLDWENTPKSYWTKLVTWKNAVFVFDPSQTVIRHGVGDGYFQPGSVQQRCVPVYVQDGKGSITLCGQPQAYNTLEVSNASCGEIIKFVR